MLLFGLSACVSEEKAASDSSINDAMVTLRGAISYRDNNEIPPGSDIYVRLLDITNGLEKATEVNSISFEAGKGTIPFPFAIEYDPTKIEPGGKYALDAEIKYTSVNMYYTLEPIEVINSELKNDIAIILVKGPKPRE